MKLVVFLMVTLIICISAFYGACFIVRLWSGCSMQEAATKVQDFVTQRVQYHFETDPGFVEEIGRNVQNIIGEKRYQRLCALENTIINPPLLFFGTKSGLSYVAFSLYCQDENEKQILESVLTNITIHYLQLSGYNTWIIKKWSKRDDLAMPVFEICYARTEEEKKALFIARYEEREKIIAENSAVIDDTELTELDG